MAMQETCHFCHGNEVFYNKTFDLVCFLHFSGVELILLLNKVGGSGACFHRKFDLYKHQTCWFLAFW